MFREKTEASGIVIFYHASTPDALGTRRQMAIVRSVKIAYNSAGTPNGLLFQGGFSS